jgi:LCP family protein required for cell wall assembly
MGRGAAVNGNGRVVLPPTIPAPVLLSPPIRYQQPRPRRRVLRILGKTLLWLFVAAGVVGTGLAGGAYLYFDEEIVAQVRASSPDVREAAKELDIAPAGEPAIALVVGYDKRAHGPEAGLTGRSDTIMLVRADPQQKALSLLSFPRDLIVDIRCPGRSPYRDRINAAYSQCGARGTLETVRSLTGLPINYLITVNFRGFKQMVAKVGGVWADVDQRYFNDNAGGYATYATIDLLPGYQKLNGSDSLDFVRYRHTDSDLYRVARQQLFVSAFRDAVTDSFSPTNIPKIVKTITDNVEVGVAGDKALDKKTVWSYALFAYQLPSGHVFQSKLEGLSGYNELYIDQANVHTAIQEFTRPDVEAPEKATSVALGRKPRAAVGPPPRQVALTVLNGNGITGSASNASYQLGRLGYRIVLPPSGAPANAPSFDYFHSKVHFDQGQPRARLAARKVANLFGDADLEPLPASLRPLANGAMVTVVVGQTFDGNLAPAPIDRTPTRQPAAVVKNPAATLPLVRWAQKRVRFPLQMPSVIEKTSFPARQTPLRVYRMAGRPAVRLTFSTGASEYWGVQMTTWDDAPVLSEPNTAVTIGRRRYELHYAGPKLHMVVLRDRGATYWVVNTLLDSLSNETMLAIAKGLRPLARS